MSIYYQGYAQSGKVVEKLLAIATYLWCEISYNISFGTKFKTFLTGEWLWSTILGIQASVK